MNGQHLRALPSNELVALIGERWKSIGVLAESEGLFIEVRSLSLLLILRDSYYTMCLGK